MEGVGIIASVVAAVAAVLTLIVTIRNTKGNILKRIGRKERQIVEIDNYQCRMYGLDRMKCNVTPLDQRVSKLQSEVEELRRRL